MKKSRLSFKLLEKIAILIITFAANQRCAFILHEGDKPKDALEKYKTKR
ncbi:cyclic lactone autoinducer peptide [Listeria monocytogenes]|uniref:Cyclic lactone autoinducer peptide n=1 Tax=Listeria monocytogenes TaxID=1639 RepID=A0AAN2WG59_LISMN|nr:cyclic lactone autoinducer peptide [Listeria monocytogenes]EAC3367771.1 cyclic lactone autoinducer peptide [Listeria monocytogenes]EAC7084999.1 cyclic lactone autoinducer peptide [Listeria monocytogenes]EAC8542026.1 cyclic lactone autoinducer peptide [Listeria monocytogenes]EAC8548027.1 cyclic lactone autoinducer peptide [Listeria monocytogenes]